MKPYINKTLEKPSTIFHYKNKNYLSPYSLFFSMVTHTFFTRESSHRKLKTRIQLE